MNEQKLDYEKIKMGMMVFFESDGSWSSRLVEQYQLFLGFDVETAAITHCGVCMRGPHFLHATSPLSRTDDFRKKYLARKKHFLYLRDQEFRWNRKADVTVWAATRCNLKYGWLSWFGYLLNLILPIIRQNLLHVKRNPVCSLLIIWALRLWGYDPCHGVSSGLVTPAHLFASPAFEEVDCSKG